MDDIKQIIFNKKECRSMIQNQRDFVIIKRHSFWFTYRKTITLAAFSPLDIFNKEYNCQNK